jgi:hypothetical protein
MTIIEKENVSFLSVDTIKNIIFEKHHIVLFVVIICILLFLSEFSFLKKHSIYAYQVVAFPTAYQYINTNMTVYNILGSSFIASFTAYFIYQLLYRYFSVLFINITIIFLVIIFTDLANCFNISSLIYAMVAVKEIPRIKKGYLFSYFFACLIIIFIYFLYSSIVSLLKTKFHLLKNYDFLPKKWY